MEFFKRANWKNLIIMALCGVGFYFAFDKVIESSKKQNLSPNTFFIIEIVADGLTDNQKIEAMESTLGVFKDRMEEINIHGATVRRQGTKRIVISIPRVMLPEEMTRAKEILTRQDRILYKLKVYGPMNRLEKKDAQ